MPATRPSSTLTGFRSRHRPHDERQQLPAFRAGGEGNDRFEVNHNRAALYLHGGSGDDLFLLRTFLVLRENPDNPDEITNLNNIFGGTGMNRYNYLRTPLFSSTVARALTP